MIFISPKFNKSSIGISQLTNKTKKGLRYGFYLAGKSLTRESRKLIDSPPKTGRLYWVSIGSKGRKLKNRRLHRASAAGEAPAKITGNLKRSVNFVVHGSNILEFGSDINYGKFLELGTVKMAPRPFLIKAIKNDAKNTINYVRRSIIAKLNV